MASRSADGALSAAGVLLVGIYDWPGRRLRIAGARSETASLAGKSRDASAGSHQTRLQPAFGRGDHDERHPQASRAGDGPAATGAPDVAGKAGGHPECARQRAERTGGSGPHRRAAHLRLDVSAERARRSRRHAAALGQRSQSGSARPHRCQLRRAHCPGRPGTSDGFRVATGGCHREGERGAAAKAIGRDHTAIHVGAARPADRGRWLAPGHRTQPGESRGVGARRTDHRSAHRRLAIERVAGARLPIRDVETSGPATRSDQSARADAGGRPESNVRAADGQAHPNAAARRSHRHHRSAANFCRPDGDDQECLGCCADASNRFGETDANDRQHRGAASRVDDPRDARSRVSSYRRRGSARPR